MPPTGSSPRGFEQTAWRLTPGLRLHMRLVGDMVAVLNEESGDTHLVAPWAARILERLRTGPAGPAELVDPEKADGEERVRAVVRSLGEFRYLGLIEPVDP